MELSSPSLKFFDKEIDQLFKCNQLATNLGLEASIYDYNSAKQNIV